MRHFGSVIPVPGQFLPFTSSIKYCNNDIRINRCSIIVWKQNETCFRKHVEYLFELRQNKIIPQEQIKFLMITTVTSVVNAILNGQGHT